VEFKHGISPVSLTRWFAVQNILKLQEESGTSVDQETLEALVNEELAAIEHATRRHELRELELSYSPHLARMRSGSPSGSPSQAKT
jgi:hypothetical protein